MRLAHASERAAERMGVALSVNDLNAMCEKIRAGQGVRLRDRKNGAQQWVVTHNGRAFRVVYLHKPNIICTVLDPIGTPQAKRAKQQRR